MEVIPSPDKQESKFEEGTFGNLVESYDPSAFKVFLRDNKDADSYESRFAAFKDDLLALCPKPDVKISPQQNEVIKGFLKEIFEFTGFNQPGEDWIKINNEKQLVLATYINSLQK